MQLLQEGNTLCRQPSNCLNRKIKGAAFWGDAPWETVSWEVGHHHCYKGSPRWTWQGFANFPKVAVGPHSSHFVDPAPEALPQTLAIQWDWILENLERHVLNSKGDTSLACQPCIAVVQKWDRLLGPIAVFPLVGCLQCLTVVLRSCRIAIYSSKKLAPAPRTLQSCQPGVEFWFSWPRCSCSWGYSCCRILMEAGSEAVAFFASEAGMRRMRTWSQKCLKQCPDQAAAQNKSSENRCVQTSGWYSLGYTHRLRSVGRQRPPTPDEFAHCVYLCGKLAVTVYEKLQSCGQRAMHHLHPSTQPLSKSLESFASQWAGITGSLVTCSYSIAGWSSWFVGSKR